MITTEIIERRIAGDKENFNLLVVPIAASHVQFVITDDINEIMAVGYQISESQIMWKFGAPNSDNRQRIEALIISELHRLYDEE